MSKISAFPLRQVHLDFHNSNEIPDIGADWNAQHFIQTLQRAHVESITVFAKCHHGLNYYPSQIGPVHPSLEFDLLGAQIEACHKAGIRAPIYLSVVWDMSAAERHPEWRQVNGDGKLTGRGPFDSGHFEWSWMCVNTAYTDELIAQTEELMDRYECDGFFYDILMYGDGCCCTNCLSDMQKKGLDPSNPKHRQIQNTASARNFMKRISSTIRARLPNAGIFYNARWGLQFEDEAEYYSQVEIESLPTGGWGYGFYPLWSRFARNFNLPMLGMTGRFHRSWADWGGLKHPAALRFECGGILATGGAISIGDQLHPRGRLNEAVYDVIAEAFNEVRAVEEYCTNVKAVPQIGLLVLGAEKVRGAVNDHSDAVQGAGKMLLELHHQFDVITDYCQDFSKYQVLLIPDEGTVNPEITVRLKAFVASGGKILLSNQALLEQETRVFALADQMGVDYVGECGSVPDYFKITEPALFTNTSRADFAYSLYEGPGVRVQPRDGTQRLAEGIESYFNRTWEHFSSHAFTPPKHELAGYPAITKLGGVIYISGPIFGAYEKHGNLTFRAVVGQCLKLLLPEQILQTDAPASSEVSLMRQGNTDIVHIVNYHPGRRASGHTEVLEEPIPLHNVNIHLQRTFKTNRVKLARANTALDFQTRDGMVSVVVPRIGTHEMIIFEE